jgi:hypothetical protein
MPNSLVIDNRATVQGPGLHALIVGVSEYTNLPNHDDPPDPATWDLKKLGAPALSAFRLMKWLEQPGLMLSRPLKTCRVLLSPSKAELAIEPALPAFLAAHAAAGQNNGVPSATRDEFQEAAIAWRDDAKDDPENVTFFYFGGHGIQLGPEEAIMIFADIFDKKGPTLSRCARFSNLRNGMAPSAEFDNIANRQFYFVDCCRYMPEPAKDLYNPQVPEVFEVTLNTLDRREAPVFFATVDGSIATGWRGQETVFAKALLHALKNGADDAEEDVVSGSFVYPVRATSLKVAIESYILRNDLDQDVVLSSLVKDPVLVNLTSPPQIDLEVEILPPSLLGKCGVGLLDEQQTALFQENPWKTSPIAKQSVPAGAYQIQITSNLLRRNPYSKMTIINNRSKIPWRHNLSTLLAMA